RERTFTGFIRRVSSKFFSSLIVTHSRRNTQTSWVRGHDSKTRGHCDVSGRDSVRWSFWYVASGIPDGEERASLTCTCDRYHGQSSFGQIPPGSGEKKSAPQSSVDHRLD